MERVVCLLKEYCGCIVGLVSFLLFVGEIFNWMLYV